MYIVRIIIFFIVLFLSVPTHAVGLKNKLLQNTGQPTTQLQEKPTIEDEFNRGTPRSSVEKFLESIRRENYQTAINFLDFSETNQIIRAMPREEVAKKLQLVLDRSLWVDLHSLSDDITGFQDDDIVGQRDLVGYVKLPNKETPIYVQRVAREDGVLIWKIAGISINHLPELYQQYSDGPVGEMLSVAVPDISVFGLKLWQWITLVLMIIGSIILTWIPTRFLASRFRKSDHAMSGQLASIISGPIFVLIVALLLRWGCGLLSLSIEARQVSQGYPLLILIITWVLLSTISILRDHLIRHLAQDNKKTAANLLRPLTTILKIVIIITAALVWLENLGFKATTILAGLGIGGLAFALAAQKTIENIIAGITLFAASPVKVGNLCRFGKHLGFVQEIGMRYTKIRTLDSTMINISNSVFVDMELENYSERRRIRFNPQLILSHQSSAKQVKQVIADIKQLLENHELVSEKPCRVRLANYLEYGIELSVMSYVDTTKFPVYAEVANELNLEILEILAKNEVVLADFVSGGVVKEKTSSFLGSVFSK